MVKLEQIKQAFNEMQIAIGKNNAAEASEKREELYTLCDSIDEESKVRKQNEFYALLQNGVTHTHQLHAGLESIEVSTDKAVIIGSDRYVVYNLNNLAGFTVTFED